MEGYRYISHMRGEINESMYDAIEMPYREFMIEYQSLTGARRYNWPAVLRLERFFYGKKTAEEVIKYLTDYGFSIRYAQGVIRLLVADDILVDTLIRRGRSEESVLYAMGYTDRLEALGIDELRISLDFAMKSEINIRPIRVIKLVAKWYRTSMAYAYSERKKTNRQVEVRIWHQDYGEKKSDVLAESELNDKWNEAMDLLYESGELPDGLVDILDRMEEAGVEINQEIDESDLIGKVCEWYGRIIFWRAGEEKYYYDIFNNMNPQKEPLLKKTYKEYVQKDITDWS